MALIDDITRIFDIFTPYVEWIITFITPYYIAIGGIFANIALVFIGILPTDSFTLSWIIMGVFIVLGIVFAVLAEKKRED